MTEQTAVILGLARQGTALARFLAEKGVQVRVSDLRPAAALAAEMASLADLTIEYVLGEHPFALLDGADVLYLSGGIPFDAPLVQQARRRGIRLSNDSQLFLEVAPCPVVGITGSAGKTTTTALLGDMVRASGRYRQTWVGGNIGNPLLADTHRMEPDDLAVMELSSFQLEVMTMSPQVAGVLNVTPNHLDRHGTMAVYTAAKRRILDFQKSGDKAVLGWDDAVTRSFADRVQGDLWWFSTENTPRFERGCYLREEQIVLRTAEGESAVAPVTAVQLPGAHNLSNVLAACALAAAVGVETAAMRTALESFTGVEHRLELVREWRGVKWVNDSIATAPERSIAAIKAFEEPLILLLGGRDKKLPWDELVRWVQKRVKHVVLFGEAAGLIEQEMTAVFAREGKVPPVRILEDKGSGIEMKNLIEGSTAGEAEEPPDPFPLQIIRVSGLTDAVQAAAQVAQAGDVVLLAPGCTSFDEFKDFAARGERFRELVKALS